MKLYKVNADYLYGDDKKEKRELQIEALKAVGLENAEIDGCVLATTQQALDLILSEKYTSEYSVAKSVTLIYNSEEQNFEKLMSTMIEKTIESTASLFNHKCSQEQPGNLLNSVDETMLMECACTDALQDNLNNGWRILAIQPQPNQRRPDYILGRKSVPNGARRG